MKKWIRPWPWGLASLGLFLILHSACLMGFLRSTPPEGAPPGRPFRPEALCWTGIAAGGVLLAVAAWAFWRRRTRFAPEGERLRAAGWVTGISALAFLMALFPERPWVEACLWAGLLGLPLPIFCWYRALELPLLRHALRDS